MSARREGENETVHLRAEKLVGGGRALAHHGGSTWMVTGALPGELVVARPTRRRAGIVEAETVGVASSPHAAREPDPCPHSDRCGGCDWPHVEIGPAARLKALAAADAARARPDISALVAEARIHESPLAYRLRARLHWDPSARRLGFFEIRSRRVSDIQHCRVLSPELMTALPSLTRALADHCPKPVDVEWLQGSRPEEAVAALRPAKGGSSRLDVEWLPQREEMDARVAGFHVLDRAGGILGGWGPQTVHFDLPVPLTVPIGAFFQGNRHLLAALFERVAALAGPGPEPVFDLHAGVGFLAAAVLSAGDRHARLVEPHRAAAKAAALNLPAAEVAVAKTAEDFVAEAGDLPQRALVVTDPPRTGLTRSLRTALAEWRPRRILMLGCDPATWARDAGFLCDHGYRIGEVEIFDLFPSTHHVEILALLEHS